MDQVFSPIDDWLREAGFENNQLMEFH